jgi:type IV pilus assembly protein PilC
MIFTRQLATLIDAGLPLLKSLSVLAKQERHPTLQLAITQMADAVQGGSTFSESMGQHPKTFNKLYVSMVKAGELGGVLELVLTRLAEFQEKAQKIKNKVQSAMTYPIVVLCIALIILVLLMTFIVPQFEKIFTDMLGKDAQLPPLTRGVMDVSKAMIGSLVDSFDWAKQVFPGEGDQTNPLAWVLSFAVRLVSIGLFIWGVTKLSTSEKGKAFLDRLALNIPVFGDITRKSSIARFTRTLGTLVTSGVPILQALNITRETAGNVVLATAVSSVHDAVKEGESIVAPLEASNVFPPMVISMVDVGEETGQLPEMLLKIADVYDDEVDNAVEGLTSLLEPIMIVFLAVIVGTIVVALFLPMLSILEKLQSQGS